MRDIASPLKIKRKMKLDIPTRPKDLLKLREIRPVKRKGEVLSENLIEALKDLFESRKSWQE